jgi:hypothetical protein
LKSSLRKLVNRYEIYVTNDHGYFMFVVIVNHKNNISMDKKTTRYKVRSKRGIYTLNCPIKS